MKKNLTVFILVVGLKLFSFAQNDLTTSFDTISNKSQFKEVLNFSQSFLIYLKEKNIEKIKKNMNIKWEDDSLIIASIKNCSDSLTKYTIPNNDRLCVIKEIQENKKLPVPEKWEFIEVVYFLNTHKFEKKKTVSIHLLFSKELGLNKVVDFDLYEPMD